MQVVNSELCKHASVEHVSAGARECFVFVLCVGECLRRRLRNPLHCIDRGI
jgi:hypothetical protein